MIKILGLYPMQGNGGIASWTKKFLATFPDDNFRIIPVDIAPSKDFTKFVGLDRWIYGIRTFVRIIYNVRKTLHRHKDIKIMHITSGGGNGVIRDYNIAKYCHKHGLKTILHCRFGCIRETYENKGWLGKYFQKSLNQFDQIWVLDKKSADFLRSMPDLKEKVFLTPNSIEVPDKCDLAPKAYIKVGFIGNILPTKGIFELTEAVASLNNNTELNIVGIGSEDVIDHIKTLAGEKLGDKIKIIGRLPNKEAVKLMESLDIIVLPTYYEGEAFPISILEAMSHGKLVISCARAAIPDMLTALDGTACGIIVNEKSAQEIADAILYCQQNVEVADKMCAKAYEKVKSSYRTDVVYQIYRNNYAMLFPVL